MKNTETLNALTLSTENPYYVKFQKIKDKFIKKNTKKYRNKKIAKDAEAPQPVIEENYYYLCFITRRYFRDNTIISILKIAFGICAILLAVLMQTQIKISNVVKGPFMTVLTLYGVIMIPLSTLYTIANFICFLRYKNYVSTETSPLAKKIIFFYDDNTDKFKAVNWKSVFKKSDTVYKKRKRMRGW